MYFAETYCTLCHTFQAPSALAKRFGHALHRAEVRLAFYRTSHRRAKSVAFALRGDQRDCAFMYVRHLGRRVDGFRAAVAVLGRRFREERRVFVCSCDEPEWP